MRPDYKNSLEQVQTELRSHHQRWWWIGYLRGILFLAAVLLIAAAWIKTGPSPTLWWALAGVAGIAFLVTAWFHEQLSQKITRLRWLAGMHRDSWQRLERNLRAVQVPPLSVPASASAIAKDLDLAGESSLYKLLGTPRTPLGIEMLGRWMFEPATRSEILQRQAAVAVLKNYPQQIQDFQWLCEELAASQAGPGPFLNWCQESPWLGARRWLLTAVQIASVVLIAGLLALALGWLPFAWAGGIAVAALLVNFGLAVVFSGAVHERFNRISARFSEIGCYGELLSFVTKIPTADSELLRSLQRDYFQNGEAIDHLGRLGTGVWLANLRRNGILFIPYIVLQLVFFWDLHILRRLEQWKQKHAAAAQRWFQAIGILETLLALAKLAIDEPHWVVPEILEPQTAQLAIAAKGLGHPLIASSQRVDNDVTVGPRGTLLLVTGSNMSGKSTLLRSLGLNVVLAQMGSVVCAQKLQVPPAVISTSMRVSDSLADGVSFFMAELRRLKEIVDQSLELQSSSDFCHLFLLDEILQGTNSRERQIAVSQVVRRLIDQRSLGAISTHDLELATTSELQAACQTVHFCEQFSRVDGRPIMTFDYRMRQGVSPTTNALKLLELVGLK